MSVVCIIPARGGSKRIPRKNVKPFHGKPMIAWSIDVARASGMFDRVIVSTDSDEIKEVAEDCGAEVPFSRPADLSDDQTQTSPVLLHCLKFLLESGSPVDSFACVYATAPFLCVDDIKRGFDLLRKTGRDSALSVTSFGFPIQRALKIGKSGGVRFFWPEHQVTHSRDLEEGYHDAGMFYLFDAERFLSLESHYPPRQMPIILPDAVPVILPRWRVQDIDTPEDWQRAELIYHLLQNAPEGESGVKP